MRKDRYKEPYDEIPVFYCTKCLSLNIINDRRGNLTCKDCGCHPRYLDVTTIDRYTRLFTKRMGHHPLTPEPTAYDDLKECYEEDTPTILTKDECIEQNILTRDVINLNLREK